MEPGKYCCMASTLKTPAYRRGRHLSLVPGLDSHGGSCGGGEGSGVRHSKGLMRTVEGLPVLIVKARWDGWEDGSASQCLGARQAYTGNQRAFDEVML